MLFNSYAFIFAYLPIVLIITYGALRFGGTRAGTIALLIASLAFYAYWKIGVLPLLIGSIVFNYIVGRFLHRNRTAGRVDIARLFLIVGVAGDLALLAYYKYAMLLLGTVNDLTGIGVPVPSIVLPIGISFFTFTQIAFLVDVWKGKAQEYDAWRYGLFVSYFPHLIAGPILHHKDMIPQFNDALQFRITRENLAVGATIFVFGLAKKVLIADNVADAANLVFGRVIEGDHVSFAYAWLGAVSYSMQLYFDFSGYSDMAIGLSRMFGIALPLNFNSPYKSRNIVEFWRRWHMTLSQFLRDYLYIPLGGNRHGAARRYINLMLTMLLGGLWHGAAWTFALWGGLHGLMLVVNHLWRGSREVSKSRIAAAASIVLTFLCVTIAWIPFRAESLEATWSMIRGLVGLGGLELPSSLLRVVPRLLHATEAPDYIWGSARDLAGMMAWCGLSLFIAWFLPNTQQILAPYWLKSDGSPADPQHVTQPILTFTRPWAISLGLAASVMIVLLGRQTHFLYFQF